MQYILSLIIELVPFAIGGLIVFVVMRLKYNSEIPKIVSDAYYKGKKDGELQALKEHIDKSNGNQNQYQD